MPFGSLWPRLAEMLQDGWRGQFGHGVLLLILRRGGGSRGWTSSSRTSRRPTSAWAWSLSSRTSSGRSPSHGRRASSSANSSGTLCFTSLLFGNHTIHALALDNNLLLYLVYVISRYMMYIIDMINILKFALMEIHSLPTSEIHQTESCDWQYATNAIPFCFSH